MEARLSRQHQSWVLVVPESCQYVLNIRILRHCWKCLATHSYSDLSLRRFRNPPHLWGFHDSYFRQPTQPYQGRKFHQHRQRGSLSRQIRLQKTLLPVRRIQIRLIREYYWSVISGNRSVRWECRKGSENPVHRKGQLYRVNSNVY